MEKVAHLRIPLEKIKAATNNFSKENVIGKGGFGNVYKGELSWNGTLTTVAVKRLDPTLGQGNREFWMEITMLSSYRHKNLVSLVGFCDEHKGEDNRKLLVYVHESRGSLEKYIPRLDLLSWRQRLKISIDVACGLKYLHDDVGQHHRVLHRDIKSANILLNDHWEAKISDFGLSKIGLSNLPHTFVVTGQSGTPGYIDPVYLETGVLTKESDVYSFGVVLFEILCGRLTWVGGAKDGNVPLGKMAAHKYEYNKLYEFIDPDLRKQMNLNCFNVFSEIANDCLNAERSERPTMARILERLKHAFALQEEADFPQRTKARGGPEMVSHKTAEFARIGPWGTKARGGPENHWDFLLKKGHKLKMITIDHGKLIYSLSFTSESNGSLQTSVKFGGWNGGEEVFEVVLEDDEEIIGIEGTVGVVAPHTIISSLSFVTNKMTHGPFGSATDTRFSVPWEKGNFGGFYGLAGYYIDGIGVYLKASEEIARTGIWGAKSPGGPQNQWSFQLERNHHLKKITIDHGALIYSLMFTTEYEGNEHTSDKAGGWNGGDIVDEVKFAWDEEINAITGTIGASWSHKIILSLAFITNKKTHGPYGTAAGTPFRVPWNIGSFAGFYGFAGYYIDGIGVYLKPTV